VEELKTRAENLNKQVEGAAEALKVDDSQHQLNEIRGDMAKSDFWQDQQAALTKSKQEAVLERRVKPWSDLRERLGEIEELIALGDATLAPEIDKHLKDVEKKYNQLKKDLQYQGPFDGRDVILSIHAGAGGTDAQDWAQMLLRMYSRWAERNNVDLKTIDLTAGEEAGIKSATAELRGGSFLYGKLAGEQGVHRLVRLSPFNADHLRQTSFAKVEVLPLIDSPGDIEIDEKDLKIDVFRSGGPGGQSVNTTDSAVRITHLPTGISVSVQNERSQQQNKQTALAILRSKLVQLQLEQHKQHLSEIKGPNQSAEWGNQIRNYVLHPYKQVKDVRTGFESSDPQKILGGDLEPLIEAWLEHRAVSG
jgi:peptide chain release factor 2